MALAASCASYDRGNDWEAPRLATTIFTLVHDGGGIRSLLTQLGFRASLRFVSTGRYSMPPGVEQVFASPALVGFEGGPKGLRFIPQFQLTVHKPKPTRSQFEKWWKNEDIIDSGDLHLTRRRLVFALRHQDGGAHVGEITDFDYSRLKAGAGFSGSAADGSVRKLIEAAPATIRQVAWEVTETLKDLDK